VSAARKRVAVLREDGSLQVFALDGRVLLSGGKK
jgi:hypothetical protein